MPRRTSACSTSPPARSRKKESARGSMTWPTDAPGPPKRSLTTSVANMAYHIEFADRAARDLEALYVEKNDAESEAASRLVQRHGGGGLRACDPSRSQPYGPGSSKAKTRIAAPALRQETSRVPGPI